MKGWGGGSARHTALGERQDSGRRLGDQRPWPLSPPPWAWRRSRRELVARGGPAAKYPDSGQAWAEALSPLSGQVAATLSAFCGLYLEPGRTRGGCGLARLLRHFSTPTSPFPAWVPGQPAVGRRVSTHLGGRSHTLEGGDAPRPGRELLAQWVRLAPPHLLCCRVSRNCFAPPGRRGFPQVEGRARRRSGGGKRSLQISGDHPGWGAV